jgi:hypothetical protein
MMYQNRHAVLSPVRVQPSLHPVDHAARTGLESAAPNAAHLLARSDSPRRRLAPTPNPFATALS